MRTTERGAVYNGRDEIIGFRCADCNNVVPSMFGDICNKCREEKRRHNEIVNALKEKHSALSA